MQLSLYLIKEMSNGEIQRKEIYCMPLAHGKGRVSISAHLQDTTQVLGLNKVRIGVGVRGMLNYQTIPVKCVVPQGSQMRPCHYKKVIIAWVVEAVSETFVPRCFSISPAFHGLQGDCRG
jgi:hypothetical protein